jgi:hypothetical protein
MTERGTERRKAHRVDAHLNLKLHLDLPDSQDDDLETLNVSSSGIYFRSQAYIEPMTKLALSFEVPVSEGGQAEVECEGIVARVVPELPDEDVDGYEIAVFFTTIGSESLRSLEDYVEHRLRLAGN